MNLPTLYKKTSTGAIQYWKISVIENPDHSVGHDIWTHYGQVDGKEQRTVDAIFEGKNIGKKNETTPFQQAEKEAKARWEKQKKKGYVESIEAAKAGELDELIEGGIVPMLAHKFTEQAHKIKYPAFVQPKLDGIRCIAILENGKCTLWSRTRKPITSMPHIVAEIESLAVTSIDGPVIFDGELYNHDYRNNFEVIVSLVRQQEPDPNHALAHYHIYDFPVKGMDFHHRWRWLMQAWQHMSDNKTKSLQLVDTQFANSDEEVMAYFYQARQLGYEGCMVRNGDGLYVNKRSYDLLKVKEFEDAEFEIIGIDEGRGKLQGHVGSFVCRAANGKEFLAKMSGETAKLKEYFENHSLWKSKRLTVQYQGLTGTESVPRFPVGIAIRDYE